MKKSLFINISDEENFPGIKIYETKLLKKGTAVILPPLGIFIHENVKGIYRTQMLQHEYGHYLDFLSMSGKKDRRFIAAIKFYLFSGLPSLINAATGIGGRHRFFKTEIRANKLAIKWFNGKLAEGFRNYYPDGKT
jgi:hypothetical protein